MTKYGAFGAFSSDRVMNNWLPGAKSISDSEKYEMGVTKRPRVLGRTKITKRQQFVEGLKKGVRSALHKSNVVDKKG
jgi:hypothetical protein